MSSSSFRSGNCFRPGFFDPSSSSLSRRRVRGVGVPPPYDGSERAQASEGGCGSGSGSDSCRHRDRHEVIAQMHGREISFTHTVFVVVALLLFCVYFVAFIDRMRLNAINATRTR